MSAGCRRGTARSRRCALATSCGLRPGVKHWHAATPTNEMTHIGIQENVASRLDGARHTDAVREVNSESAVVPLRLRTTRGMIGRLLGAKYARGRRDVDQPERRRIDRPLMRRRDLIAALALLVSPCRESRTYQAASPPCRDPGGGRGRSRFAENSWQFRFGALASHRITAQAVKGHGVSS